MDLRFINRPIFGLSGAQDVDAEKAASLGFPAKPGLLIEGVTDGLGAAAAGLQSGDLLVRLGGKKIKDYNTLVAALQRFHAGDKIKVVFYRQNEKVSAKAQLSARPLPDVPFSVEALADAVEANNHMLAQELGGGLQTASEEAAAYRPSPGEWNARENLAHLIANERDLQAWITSLIEGQDSSTIFQTQPPRPPECHGVCLFKHKRTGHRVQTKPGRDRSPAARLTARAANSQGRLLEIGLYSSYTAGSYPRASRTNPDIIGNR